MKKLLAVVPILAIILVADYFYSKYNVAPELNFSSLALTTLDGQPIQLNNFKGKKLFVHFFGTNEKKDNETPTLELAQSKLGADNFLFLCISDEPVETLKSYQQKTGLRIPILHSSKKLTDLNILTLPTSYVLNPKGDLVYKKTGEKDWEDSETLHELRMASE